MIVHVHLYRCSQIATATMPTRKPLRTISSEPRRSDPIYADLYRFLAEHLLKYDLFFGPLAVALAHFKERCLG